LRKNWTLFVASRYIFKGRSNSPVLAVLSIATGVFALIVIISVMNGFQLGFIESILEISSYHVRMESFSEDKIDALKEIALSVPGVKAAVPFREFQALAKGRRTSQQAVLVRGLEKNIPETDRTMRSRLDFEEGSFDISEPDFVLMGAELARKLSLGVDDEVVLFSLTGILSAQQEEESSLDTFIIKGIFRTGYYEYDSTWAFINIENNIFSVNESDLKLGVKLSNRFQDKHTLELIKKKLPAGLTDVKLSSWRDYNRSFFGALRTEKLFMFILVGLIFIVVGLNIFQAQRRSVLQRREEIGLLRAVGGSEGEVKFIFVCDGAFIGFTGAVLGLFLGLLVSFNIPEFFTLVENVVNTVRGLLNTFTRFLGIGLAGNFAVFSPSIFYLKEIPSRVLPHEVIIIFMFGFLSALTAGYFASRKIAKIEPAEVLRYE